MSSCPATCRTCSESATHMTDHLHKGDVLRSRYLVEGHLGDGTYAQVYKALDNITGEIVVLKLLNEGEGTLDQLVHEFRLLASLQHPHIARVLNVEERSPGTFFLLLQHINGHVLSEDIREGAVPSLQAKQYTLDLMDALGYLHLNRIMHRDIKPSNLLVDGRHCFIIDFNVSKRVESHASTIVGTRLYIPPEVYVSGWNWTCDLYSAGIVIYQMLTGTLPFPEGEPLDDDQAIDPREINPSIGHALATAIMKAIATEPGERFQSAPEMSHALASSSWDFMPTTKQRSQSVGVSHAMPKSASMQPQQKESQSVKS